MMNILKELNNLKAKLTLTSIDELVLENIKRKKQENNISKTLIKLLNKGKTITELSKNTGISRVTITRILKGYEVKHSNVRNKILDYIEKENTKISEVLDER